MPITKKKGAIFAIHADTPDKASTSAAPLGKSPTKKPLFSLGTTTRKALTVKQATQPQFRALPSSPNTKATLAKESLSDDLLKPSNESAKTIRKPLMEKRVRRAESPSSDAATIDTATATTTTASAIAKATRTPAKKARVTDRTPVRAQAIIDQHVDDTGSPASRTRSKTRSTQSPATANPTATTSTIRSRPHRPTVSSRQPQMGMDVFDDNAENIPIPISKQVLDRRRGNDIVDLLNRAGSEGPSEAEMAEYERAYDEHIESHRKGGASGSGSKPKLKGLGLDLGNGRRVWDHGPLLDVSEAYGATASEPRGFKAQ